MHNSKSDMQRNCFELDNFMIIAFFGEIHVVYDRKSKMMASRTGSVGSSIANGAGRGETVYSFTIEECILQNHANHHVHCPTHHDIHLAQVAPDTVSAIPRMDRLV